MADYCIWKKTSALLPDKKEKKFKPLVNAYAHLTKWFNPQLTIDVEGAEKEIEKLFPIRIQSATGVRGQVLMQKADGRFKAMRAVKRLASGDFYHKVDDNIGRFHSNLTGLKKELRNYITYDGKRLVNLDIKNSQPLLSGVLLKPKFYERGEFFNIWSIKSLDSLLNNKLYILQHSIPSILNSIMLGESAESLIHKEFQEYLGITQSGNFYEAITPVLYPGERKDRQDIKTDVYIIFFSKNKCGRRLKKNKMPFKKYFPTIYAIFNALKKHNQKVLSHILQRIESHIVIEKATRRIAEERPELPIFTIHDSIATTVGDEEYVESVLKEEIKAITGLTASIGKEYWGKLGVISDVSMMQLEKAI